MVNASGRILSATCRFSLGIGGLIDLAHAPLANEGGHRVTESGADLKGHGLWWLI